MSTSAAPVHATASPSAPTPTRASALFGGSGMSMNMGMVGSAGGIGFQPPARVRSTPADANTASDFIPHTHTQTAVASKQNNLTPNKQSANPSAFKSSSNFSSLHHPLGASAASTASPATAAASAAAPGLGQQLNNSPAATRAPPPGTPQHFQQQQQQGLGMGIPPGRLSGGGLPSGLRGNPSPSSIHRSNSGSTEANVNTRNTPPHQHQQGMGMGRGAGPMQAQLLPQQSQLQAQLQAAAAAAGTGAAPLNPQQQQQQQQRLPPFLSTGGAPGLPAGAPVAPPNPNTAGVGGGSGVGSSNLPSNFPLAGAGAGMHHSMPQSQLQQLLNTAPHMFPAFNNNPMLAQQWLQQMQRQQQVAAMGGPQLPLMRQFNPHMQVAQFQQHQQQQQQQHHHHQQQPHHPHGRMGIPVGVGGGPLSGVAAGMVPRPPTFGPGTSGGMGGVGGVAPPTFPQNVFGQQMGGTNANVNANARAMGAHGINMHAPTAGAAHTHALAHTHTQPTFIHGQAVNVPQAGRPFPPFPSSSSASLSAPSMLGGAATTSGGLSGVPGAPPSSGGSVHVAPPKAERKPLLIFDPETGTPIDFSDIKKPEKQTASITSSLQPIPSTSTSSSSSSSSSTPSSSSSTTPHPIDVSDASRSLTPQPRQPLAIISPTKHEAEQKEKAAAAAAEAAAAAVATHAEAQSTPASTSVTVSSTSSAATASPATSTSLSSSSSSSPSPAAPYVPSQKRPLVSLSPQPATVTATAAGTDTDTARSRSPTSSPSDAATTKDRARTDAESETDNAASATPSTSTAPAEKQPSAPSSAPTVASTASAETANTLDAAAASLTSPSSSSDSVRPRPRGPILPLSGGGEKQVYRPPTKPSERIRAPAKDANVDASANAAATPSAAPSQPSSLDAKAKGEGRKVYDRDFLMQFSHIKEKPWNFPQLLQSELEVKGGATLLSVLNARPTSASVGGASPSHSPSASVSASSMSVGSMSKKDDKWSRGQSYPMAPSSQPHDGRRGVGMAPQGGRTAFAQAQQHAVRADARSREMGGAATGGRGGSARDRDRDRDGRASTRGGRDARDTHGRDRDRDRDRRNTSIAGPPFDAPVQPLVKTQNRWLPGAGIQTEMDRIKKKVQGLLNKLSWDKFTTLTSQLTDLLLEHKSEGLELLVEVVGIIFDKALGEQFFSSMYADLCVEVSKAVAPIAEFEGELAAVTAAVEAARQQAAREGKEWTEEEKSKAAASIKRKSPFRVLLLNKCQMEFEAGIRPIDKSGKSDEEIEHLEHQQKRRFLGNVKFIGELYKKGMLIEKTIHSCVAHLVGDLDHPNEEDLEAVCNLLMTVGSKVDHEKAKPAMDSYFDRLAQFSKNKQLSSRIRFMCLDVIDMRKSKWTSKRKPAEAKSLEAVRREAEEEEKKKQMMNRSFGRTLPTGPMTSLRPGGMLGRGHAFGGASSSGSQDIRSLGSTPKTKDRYSALKTSTSVTPLNPPAASATTPKAVSAASKSRPTPSPAPSPSPPAPTPSPDLSTTSSQIRSMLQEYIDNPSVNDARASIEDLRAPQHHYLIVSESLVYGINHSKHREAVTRLPIQLYEAQVLSRDEFERGIVTGLSTIDADFISDEMPKAAEFIGSMIGTWVAARCVEMHILTEAAAHLVAAGEAAKIYAHCSKALVEHQQQQDPSVTRSIIESGGFNSLSLMGEESVETNMQERARLYTDRRFPFFAQLYPTASYDVQLRQAILSATSGSASEPDVASKLDSFTAILSQHAADHAQVNFGRSVVELLIHGVVDSSTYQSGKHPSPAQTQREHGALKAMFSALHKAVSASNLPIAAQVGVLHTLASFVSSIRISNDAVASDLLKRLVAAATSGGMFAAGQGIATRAMEEMQKHSIHTQRGFKEATQGI